MAAISYLTPNLFLLKQKAQGSSFSFWGLPVCRWPYVGRLRRKGIHQIRPKVPLPFPVCCFNPPFFYICWNLSVQAGAATSAAAAVAAFGVRLLSATGMLQALKKRYTYLALRSMRLIITSRNSDAAMGLN